MTKEEAKAFFKKHIIATEELIAKSCEDGELRNRLQRSLDAYETALKALNQQTNKEDDKESVLESAQNIIADESFQYGGNSLTVLEIINAIKDGYRLANLTEVDRRIADAFDKGFDEGIRASRERATASFDQGFKEGLKASKKTDDKPIFS